MGSRIVCCFVLYSAFDSKIMQLANRRLLSRNSTTKLWKWNELHVEGGGLFSCPT